MLPPESFLVTLNVSSLYAHILHGKGIAACEEALNSKESPVPPTADFYHLIRLILSLNSFTFSKKHYLQIQGTAILYQLLCKLVHREVGTVVPTDTQQET